VTTVAIVALGSLLPYSPLARLLGFVPLPAPYWAFLLFSVITYLFLVEIAKRKLFGSHS
jgi:Mg2+-importing ATPase